MRILQDQHTGMNRIDWPIALAVTAVWGINFSVIKYGLAHVDPLGLAALRFSLCALPIAFGVRRPAIGWPWVVTYGLCFGAGTWGLMTLAIHLGVAPGLSAWLLQAHAFITPLLGWIWLREPVSPRQRLAVLMAMAGFVVVLGAQQGHGGTLGLLAVGGAALSISLANLMVRHTKLTAEDALPLLVWSSPVSAVLLMTGWIGSTGIDGMGDALLRLGHLGAWVSLLFQAVPVTLVGYGLWTRLIVRHGPGAIAPFGLLVPMWALLFAGLWHGQWPGPIEVSGMALIALGLAWPWLAPWMPYSGTAGQGACAASRERRHKPLPVAGVTSVPTADSRVPQKARDFILHPHQKETR